MSDIEGLEELLEALDETALSLGEKRQLIVKALRKASEPIQEEAIARAPRLTGRLKANIGIAVTDQTAEGAEAHIGPTSKAFYGLFQEIGTIHMTGKPWLGPAYDAREDEALEIISEILGEGIEEAFG